MSSITSTSTSASTVAAPSRGRVEVFALLALAAVPFLFGLGGSFVYDDTQLLAANPLVQDLGRLPELLSGSLWEFATPESQQRVPYWRPLTSLVFALLWAVGGGAPLVFKLASLAAHLAAVFGVRRFAELVTDRRDLAFAAALLFGVHPLAVEAVTWISAINDPLMLALVLAGLASWIGWRRSGSVGAPVHAVALLAIAMLAKESALVFALLPPLLDATVLRAVLPEGAARWRRPLAAIAVWLAVYYLLRVLIFGDWHGGLLGENVFFAADTGRLLGLRVELLGGGLMLALWPSELAVFRPFRPGLGWTDVELLLPLAVLLATAISLVVLRRRRDQVALVALAFAPLVLLLPALRIQSLGQFPLSDRFVYAALPGVALTVVLVLARGAERIGRLRLAYAACAALALALGVRAAQRTSFWHDERSFWTGALEESPDIAHVQWNVGRMYLEDFRRAPALATAQAAYVRFETALDLGLADKEGHSTAAVMSFDLLQAQLGLAWSLMSEAQVDEYGDLDSALVIFETIAERRPESYEAWTGRGAVLAGKRDSAGAIESFERALAIYPDYPEARLNFGLVLLGQNRFEEASRELERALALRPDRADIALFAARATTELGDAVRARELAGRARELAPEDPAPVVLLGILARRENDLPRALQLFEEARHLAPGDADALYEHGKTLLLVGRRNDAVFEIVEAARLGWNRFEPQYNAAALLLEDGVPVESVLPYLRRAYELCPDPALLGRLRGSLDSSLPPADPVRTGLALLDEGRGDLDSAVHWASGPAEGSDEDGTAAYVLGRLLLARSEWSAALEWLERANERRPDDYMRLREVGTARAWVGDAEGALSAWRRAIEVLPEVAAGERELRDQILLEPIADAIERLERGEIAPPGATGRPSGDLIGPLPANRSESDR